MNCSVNVNKLATEAKKKKKKQISILGLIYWEFLDTKQTTMFPNIVDRYVQYE